MNTTQTQLGDLLVSIKINIVKADYEEKVNESLKKLQHKANVPGFRPGKVPFGMINKMYGNNVKMDELNNLVSENLNKHIIDNKLNIIGYPLSDLDQKPIEFDKQDDMEFNFVAALRPEIDVQYAKAKLNFFHVIADDADIQKTIDNIIERNPDITHTETIADDDKLEVKICEAENGKEVEDGFKKTVYLYLDKITDKKSKQQLIGKALGSEFIFNFAKAFKSEEEAAKFLGQDAPADSDFNIVIDDIEHHEKAQLDETLFKKIFPEKDIKDLDEFKLNVKEEMEKQYAAETDRVLFPRMIDKLVEVVKFNLPDEFLKRWIVENSQGKISEEEVEQDYEENYSKGLRWQLIEDAIVKDNMELVVTDDEVKDFLRKQVFPGINYETLDDDMKARIDKIAESYMKEEEHIEGIKNQIADVKMTGFLKDKMAITYKDVTYEAFIKELEEKPRKTSKSKKAAKPAEESETSEPAEN